MLPDKYSGGHPLKIGDFVSMFEIFVLRFTEGKFRLIIKAKPVRWPDDKPANQYETFTFTIAESRNHGIARTPVLLIQLSSLMGCDGLKFERSLMRVFRYGDHEGIVRDMRRTNPFAIELFLYRRTSYGCRIMFSKRG